MKPSGKKLLSFTTAFLFMFSLISSIYMNKVQAYSNNTIFNDVRVGLVSMSNTSLTAVLNGSYTLNGVNQPSGTILNLKVSNGLVNVNGVDYSDVQLLPLTPSSLLILTSGTITYKYYGKFLFKVSSGKLLPINSLDMETYLKGVVGHEMSDYFPLEALKAQAVAARNYALIKLGSEAAKGYDFDDTILYQVYKGYDEKLLNVIKAVEETRFVVLLYNDRPIEALYSAWHGGYEEDAVNVWGNAVAYLKAKPDSFENDPWPNGSRAFTNAQMSSTLKSRGWLLSSDTFVRLDLSSITRFTSGRVANINIIYRDSTGVERVKSVTKDKTRTFLGLPSNMFNVVYDSAAGIYTFTGKGNGHGLGMSQIGAKNRAASGQTYEQILKFYYDGTYLQNLTPKSSISSFVISSNEIYANESIDINTLGSGGSGNYLYKYQIMKSGIEVISTEFSEVSYLSYQPLQSGSYEIVSYIKDKYSPLSFDEKQSKFLNVIDRPVSSISVVNQSSQSTLIGQSVTFQAVGDEGSLYKFDVIKDNITFSSMDFTTSNSFEFTAVEPGTYTVNVYSRHSSSLNQYDDLKTLNVTAFSPPTITNFTSDKLETTPGQQVNFTVESQLGSGNNLYKFVILKDSSVITESTYTSSNIYSYVPSSTGNYTVEVYMKDNLSGSYNDTKALYFTVINNAANLDALINKQSTIVGQPVKVTAIGSEGSGQGYLYKYDILKDGIIVASKEFGSDSDFVYIPSSAGNYTANIYVKDIISTKEFDNMKTLYFSAYSAPQINTVKSTGKMYQNTPVTITGNITSSSPAGYIVKYQVYYNGLIAGEYELNSSSEFTFIPDKSGRYTIIAHVRDAVSENSFDTSKTFDLTISSAPMVVSKLPISYGMRGSDVVTIQTGLTKLGYSVGTIDGIYGSKTSTSVSNFQKSMKLKPTGSVDTETFNAMNAELLRISQVKVIYY